MNEVSPIIAEFKRIGLPEPADPPQAKKLWDASKAMESFFSQYMLKELGKTMPGRGKVPGSSLYGDMFKESVAEEIADSNTLGLAENIYLTMAKNAELLKEKENSDEPAI